MQTAPPVISGQPKRSFHVFWLLIAAAVIAFAGRAYFAKRSLPGRIVRFIQGEAGAQQTVNDLAEDIRTLPELAPLQEWSLTALDRFQAGQVQTNGIAAGMFPENVRLAASERPHFVTKSWGETNRWGQESPEISVTIASNGQPAGIVIAWYLHGIVIGPPEYQLPFKPWCSVRAKPGVWVYHIEK